MSNDNGEDCINHPPPRVALLTASGGALGVVGLAGPAAWSLVEVFFFSTANKPEWLAVGEVRFGHWRHQACRIVEPVVLVRTAPDRWEIHAHGGRAVAESMVRGLSAAGGVECSGHDWPPGTANELTEHSLQQRLTATSGWRAAQILSRQLAGRFNAELKSIEQRLAEASQSTTADLTEVKHDLQRLKRAARIGLRLSTPWRVVLRGTVNVGKSSLVNALAGYSRCLVSPLAGTTRDLLETTMVLDGWELALVDTAGEQQGQVSPPSGVERIGIERGRTAAGTADLVLDLTPAIDFQKGSIPKTEINNQRLAVATKADLLPSGVANSIAANSPVILTSALTGTGIDRLAEAIIQRLVPEASAGDLDQGVPVTTEQITQLEQLQRQLNQQPAEE